MDNYLPPNNEILGKLNRTEKSDFTINIFGGKKKTRDYFLFRILTINKTDPIIKRTAPIFNEFVNHSVPESPERVRNKPPNIKPNSKIFTNISPIRKSFHLINISFHVYYCLEVSNN